MPTNRCGGWMHKAIRQISADTGSRNSLCNYRKLDHLLACRRVGDVKREFRDPQHHCPNAQPETYLRNLMVQEKAPTNFQRLFHKSGSKATVIKTDARIGSSSATVYRLPAFEAKGCLCRS